MAGQNYCEECGRSLEERSQKSMKEKSMSYCVKCGKLEKASPIESGKKALEKTRSVRKDIDNLLSLVSNIKDDDISDAFRFVKTAKQLSAEMSRADTLIQNRIREVEHRSR